MDWLNDKKNQPIVIGILVVIIVGAVLAVFMMNRPSAPAAPESAIPPETASHAPATATGQTPSAGNTAGPQPTPSASTTTVATTSPAPSIPAAAVVVAIKPMEAWRTDPFLPLNYKPPRHGPRTIPPISDLPIFRIPVVFGGTKPPVQPDLPQPPRRMAGLLMSDRVYAIIESNGRSEIVQPGDTLSDRLAVVERIERDRVVLKTKDPKPKYLIVRMAASAQVAGSSPSSSPESSAGGSRGGGLRTGRGHYGTEPTQSGM